MCEQNGYDLKSFVLHFNSKVNKLMQKIMFSKIPHIFPSDHLLVHLPFKVLFFFPEQFF